MKYLSKQEYNFLKNPDEFNRNYQYVLKHRIKKKRFLLEDTLAFIEYYKESIGGNER